MIVPVYNCRAMLLELHRRLSHSLSGITDNFVIVLVDDVARDNPWPLICEIGQQDKRVKGIRLSRNFGQHNALTAGIDLTRANWYVIMDCDLQDAPEDIPRLYEKALEGHQVVAGMRAKEGHGLFKRHSSRIFYFFFKVLSGVHLESSTGNFRIFSDQVAEGFRQLREQLRFLPASFEWMGFNPVYIPLAHHPRQAGRSSYTFRKLIHLASSTIIAYTQIPLRLVAWTGIVMSVISFALGVIFLARALLFGTQVAGWPSLMITILFMGSLQVALTGILGVYIGKTFEETKRRPLYIVSDTVNLEAEGPAREAHSSSEGYRDATGNAKK